LGLLIAAALAGSWRRDPPPAEISSADLDLITPLLLKSGAGGLAWRRVRGSDLRATPAGRELQQAFRLHCLQAAISDQSITRALQILRGAGVDPLLIKGWSNARLYPESGVRPFGDIDLVVRPEQYALAEAVISQHPDPHYPIDLHARAAQFAILSAAELFDRSQLVRLGEIEVLIPGPEDHLRILCLHLLCHGAWRPLWLCDIAAAVESRPAGFDWDRCLTGNRREADWVAGAIGLAHQLLGADLAQTPIERRVKTLPRWLASAVLRRWDRCQGASLRQPFVQALLGRRNLNGLLEEISFRWDRPIQATLDVRAPFNNLPRLPFQIAAVGWRGPQFVRQLWRRGRGADPR
jgi:hypothetical protein